MANVANKAAIIPDGGLFTAIANGAVTKYRVVKVSTDSADGEMRVALVAGGTDVPCGVATHDAADGEPCSVQYLGIAWVEANGAYTAADRLAAAASTGRVDTATSGDYVIGIALNSAAAQADVMSVLLTLGPKQA